MMHIQLIAVWHSLHKHLLRKWWENIEAASDANFGSTHFSEFSVWEYLPSQVTKILALQLLQLPLVLPADDMWGWCWPLFVLRSSVAYSSVIYTLEMKEGHQWEPATCWEQVFTCCSTSPPSHPTTLPWSFLCNPTAMRCSFYNWVSRSTYSAPHDVRDAWLPNIEMDQKWP